MLQPTGFVKLTYPVCSESSDEPIWSAQRASEKLDIRGIATASYFYTIQHIGLISSYYETVYKTNGKKDVAKTGAYYPNRG
jgi:hypothetical protein